LLLTAASLRAPQLKIEAYKRALGDEFYDRLIQLWRTRNSGGQIGLFPPHALVVLPSGGSGGLTTHLSVVGAPEFDWGVARELLTDVDRTAELAKTCLRKEYERIEHLERAWALATVILGAVNRERWRRNEARLPLDAPPSARFAKELEDIRAQVAHAERLLVRHADRNAENVYVLGMFAGAAALALFSSLIGVLLLLYKVPASTGIAFATGGLGGVISVLQRLTTGHLEVDHQASIRRTLVFGAVRPFVGAVFGLFVYAVLQSGLLGLSVHPPAGLGPKLAFFGVIGFVAGFNERFAQDIVSGSAARLSHSIRERGQLASGGDPA
jgi:hypothetical protein